MRCLGRLRLAPCLGKAATGRRRELVAADSEVKFALDVVEEGKERRRRRRNRTPRSLRKEALYFNLTSYRTCLLWPSFVLLIIHQCTST